MLGLLDIIFQKILTELWPLIMSGFLFQLNSQEQIDRHSPNFIYAFILTRSMLGLLPVIFCSFIIELLPLIYVRLLFPLNILASIIQNYSQLCINVVSYP